VIGASAIGAQRLHLRPRVWQDASYRANAGPRWRLAKLTPISITLDE